nr:EOG090X032R [Lepidurus arcticus]
MAAVGQDDGDGTQALETRNLATEDTSVELAPIDDSNQVTEFQDSAQPDLPKLDMFRSKSMTIPTQVDSKESVLSRLFRKAPKRVREPNNLETLPPYTEEANETPNKSVSTVTVPVSQQQPDKKSRSRSSFRMFQSKDSLNTKESGERGSKKEKEGTGKIFRSNHELSISDTARADGSNNGSQTAKTSELDGFKRSAKSRGSLRKLSLRKEKKAEEITSTEEEAQGPSDVIVREPNTPSVIGAETPTTNHRATFALFAPKSPSRASNKKEAKLAKKAKSSTHLASSPETTTEELANEPEIGIVGLEQQPVVEKRRFSFGSFKSRSNSGVTAAPGSAKSILAASPAIETSSNSNEPGVESVETVGEEQPLPLGKEKKKSRLALLMRSKSKERLNLKRPELAAKDGPPFEVNESNESQADGAIKASVSVPTRSSSWFRSKESVKEKQNEGVVNDQESSETVNLGREKKRSSLRLFRSSSLPRLSKFKASGRKKSHPAASGEVPGADPVTDYNESGVDVDNNEIPFNASSSREKLEEEGIPKARNSNKKRLSFAAEPTDIEAVGAVETETVRSPSNTDNSANEPESSTYVPETNTELKDATAENANEPDSLQSPVLDETTDLKTIGARLATDDALLEHFSKPLPAIPYPKTKQETVFDRMWKRASLRKSKSALLHVREHLTELDGRVGAENTDLLFLKSLMDSPIMRSLVKVQDQLEESVPASKPLSSGNFELTLDLLTILKAKTSNKEAQELTHLLQDPHVIALLQSHDLIADKSYEQIHSPSDESDSEPSSATPVDRYHVDMPADISDIRIVSLRKTPGEPLGLTVKVEDGQLVVARILGGGMIDRQGLLHVGDVIGEVNGIHAKSPEELQVEIARAKEHITLKILPSFHEIAAGAQCYMRALFDYDPKEDKLLPCPEIGLAFKQGDILQIVNQSDPNWWQAKKVGWSGPAGLIPSQELEERRKAFVAPEADYVHKIGFCGTRVSRKKKKMLYQIKSSADLDKAELQLYEEVTRMPPFRRKTLILIGSEGVGRRTLKNRLINSDADRFGTVLPHTSRPMRELEDDGMGYWFVSREDMEIDIRNHQYLEYGEHNGHIYGTKLDSIRNIIRQGKMCILDCSPNSLKSLHNSPEFMPFVIFLAAPGMEQLKYLYDNNRYSSRNLTISRGSSMRMSTRRARTLESLASLYEEEDFKNAVEESSQLQRTYEKYFDMVIVNEEPDTTFRKVVDALESLCNQHQWVPVSWVY